MLKKNKSKVPRLIYKAYKNKKALLFLVRLCLVTPNFQSSNFLIEDLREISLFVNEHASLLIAS